MTILHIDEYTGKGESYSQFSGRSPDTVYPRLVKTQTKITTEATSKLSAAVDDATAFVSIRPVGGDVYLAIGSAPVASATKKFLPDGEVWDVQVDKGDKIAVINA